jgi:hypothetical protein
MKMKALLTVLVIFFARQAALADYPPAPESMLPNFLSQMSFGMTFEQFNKLPDRAKWMPTGEDDIRTSYSRSNPTPDTPWVTVYFGTEDGEPLYEFIIQYKTPTKAKEVASSLLGEANTDDGEWRFLSKGVEMRAWVFETKLVVAAVLQGTEWSDEK